MGGWAHARLKTVKNEPKTQKQKKNSTKGGTSKLRGISPRTHPPLAQMADAERPKRARTAPKVYEPAVEFHSKTTEAQAERRVNAQAALVALGDRAEAAPHTALGAAPQRSPSQRLIHLASHPATQCYRHPTHHDDVLVACGGDEDVGC